MDEFGACLPANVCVGLYTNALEESLALLKVAAVAQTHRSTSEALNVAQPAPQSVLEREVDAHGLFCGVLLRGKVAEIDAE